MDTFKINFVETIENDHNQAYYSSGHNQYYASKPITICVEVIRGTESLGELFAQTSDSMDVTDCHDVTFNSSIDANDAFWELTEREPDRVIAFCQKIYDEYNYDADAFCEKWAAELDRDPHFGTDGVVDARFFE